MKNIFKYIIIGLAFVFTTNIVAAQSAQIYFIGEADVSPGSIFNIDLLIDSASDINALEMELQYPQDIIESVGFDNANSIISLWQTKPKVLNGKIEFSGGMLKPWQGNKGQILKLQFKAKKEGKANVVLVKNNLYLADGKGTIYVPQVKNFTVEVKEQGREVLAPSASFTESEVQMEVEKEVEAIESKEFSKKAFTFSIAGGVLLIIAVMMYNKMKRKT